MSCCSGHEALSSAPGFLADAYTASPYLTALLLGPPLLVLLLCYPALVLLSPKSSRSRRLPDCAYVYYNHEQREDSKGERLADLVGDEADVQLSVVVPAYNESRRLKGMLDETVAWLEEVRKRGESLLGEEEGESRRKEVDTKARGSVEEALVKTFKSYEVLIVDDGSTDDTARIASEYASQFSAKASSSKAEQSRGGAQVRVVRLGINCGKGAAVRHGVLHARGQLILFADADGASRFSDLRVLAREMARILTPSSSSTSSGQHGVVCGSRAHLVGSEAVVKRSFVRNLLMHAFHLVLALLLRPPSPSDIIARLTPAVLQNRNATTAKRRALPAQPAIQDTQCGFKLFTRPTAQVVFTRAHIDRWIFDVELLLLAEMASRATLLDAASRGYEWAEREGKRTAVGGSIDGEEGNDVLLRLPVPIAEVAVQWAEVEGSKIALLRDSVGMALDLVILRANYALGRWPRPSSLLSKGKGFASNGTDSNKACCQ